MAAQGEFTVDDQIAKLAYIRDGYLNALATDSVTPQMNYSFDGQSVDRDGWRAQLTARIRELNELIATLQPFEITTVGN